MAKPVALPAEIVQAIDMIKSTPVDPNDFNNAVQECFNRGYGRMGTWIMEHKDLYMKALQDGYVSETDVPNSEAIPRVVDAPPPIEHVETVTLPEDEWPAEIREQVEASEEVEPEEEPKSGKRYKR